MKLAEFEEKAAGVWGEIPEAYRSGVDALVIRREPHAHPTLPDIYTLGECLTESYPSDWGGPDTTRSVLVLYYGSFRALSRLDDAFDWDYEIWETITHELRHHLESLAAEDALEDVDYAMDENFKRFQGEPFDPFFFRSGERVAPGVYQAEEDVFIEIEYDAGDPPRGGVEFRWRGQRYAVAPPDELGDVTFLQVTEGLDPGDGGPSLCVVLTARRGFLASLKRWLRPVETTVMDVDVAAERLPRDQPGD